MTIQPVAVKRIQELESKVKKLTERLDHLEKLVLLMEPLSFRKRVKRNDDSAPTMETGIETAVG